MGAYLSEPVLDKHSQDEDEVNLCYGASSMQGWRISQEDAHNSIIEYDSGKSFFAVYDGHGGHEVAEYCSKALPEFIKKNVNYKTGNYKKALEESFISFDATLVDRQVVAKLKSIADSDSENKEDGDENEINHLCEEASIPIEQLIAKYNNSTDDDSEPSKPVNPLLAGLKKKDGKTISPFLRGKKVQIGEGGSGINKHIRFDENGEEKEGDKTEVKNEEADKEIKENGVEAPKENGVKEEESTDKPSTPLANGDVKAETGDSPNSEKENKDTNGAVDTKSDASATVKTSDIKGKGKGKGKGKSSQVKSTLDPETVAAAESPASAEKRKKTAAEIYDSLLKTAPESGDEDSEDSEDEEFGADADSDDSEDGVDENGDGEGMEDEEADDEEDSDEMEEEDEDEDGIIGADFTEEPGNDSGCTAVVALMAGTRLIVANAGDSRCVVCREGKALEMSADHKPEDEIELNRIQTAGGKVTPDGRVNGGLNLSRAIGDHAYKQNKTLPLRDQMISSMPDIREVDIDPSKDGWMILACDGIWNFMSSQEVVDYIEARIHTTPDNKLSNICEELFDYCLAPDTKGDGTGCDNMTAVIIKFKSSFKDLKDVIVDADATTSKSGGSSSSSVVTASAEKDNELANSDPEPAAKRQKLNGSQ